MTEYTQLTLPGTGRFIFGDCFKQEEKKNDKGSYMVWRMAIAFAKTDQAFEAVRQQLGPIAMAAFPGGQYNQPNFSWKVSDCDAPSPQKGVILSQKYPFLAGHWLVQLESATKAPDCYIMGPTGQHQQVFQGDSPIKRGDYVAVACSVGGNGQTGQGDANGVPGLKWYLNGVLLTQQGEALGAGVVDPNSAFAGVQAQAPTNMAPAGMPAMQPGTPAQAPAPAAQAGFMQPGQPAPVAGPAPAQAAPMAPAAAPAPVAGTPSMPAAPQQPAATPPAQAALPSNPMAPAAGVPAQPANPVQPAHDFVQNAAGQPAQAGFTPAPNAGHQPTPTGMQQPAPAASPATSYPSNAPGVQPAPGIVPPSA